MNFMFVNLDKFLERGYLTPEELLELRTQNLRSEDTRDHRLIEDTVKTQMTEMIETGESPYNSRHMEVRRQLPRLEASNSTSGLRTSPAESTTTSSHSQQV